MLPILPISIDQSTYVFSRSNNFSPFLESEAPAEQHPTIYRIPARRLRPIAWTISLDDPVQQDDNNDTLGETAPPKENAQTSFEDEDDAGQSNKYANGKQFNVIICITQAKNTKTFPNFESLHDVV